TVRVSAKLWALAEALLPPSDIATYTQGLMDLGATICTRSSPRCEICQVKRDCCARREKRVDELPSPRPKKILPRRKVRVLVFERGDEILLEKRPPLGIWGGLWSFPECALGDDVRIAVHTRFGAEVELREMLPPIAHGFTHFALTLHPQRVSAARWPTRAEAPGM